MFRPQYSYPRAPIGKEDETFHYSFDANNTPLLGLALAAGQFANDIPLTLEQDAPFFCRGIKIRLATDPSNLWAKLKTPHGDYLQTLYVPLSQWAAGSGVAISGQLIVPFENEIECPAGSNWTLYLYNPTGGSVTPPAVTLFGVKRRECKKVAA